MEQDPKNLDPIPFADLGLDRRKLRTLVQRHIKEAEASLDSMTMDELWARLPDRVRGVLLREPQPRTFTSTRRNRRVRPL